MFYHMVEKSSNLLNTRLDTLDDNYVPFKMGR
jgi:hypothetical protein